MEDIIITASNHVEKLDNSFALKQINALISISASTKIYSVFFFKFHPIVLTSQTLEIITSQYLGYICGNKYFLVRSHFRILYFLLSARHFGIL